MEPAIPEDEESALQLLEIEGSMETALTDEEDEEFLYEESSN